MLSERRIKTMSINVIIADDHPLIRDGIAALLLQAGDINVVGVASDGRDAVALAERERPDVVVMDISMPGLNGIEATRQIAKGTSGAKVVCLSAHAENRYVLEALQAGASGYVIKQSSEADLVTAIRTVASGGIYLNSLHAKALKAETVAPTLPASGDDPCAITAREREVLQLIAEGLDTKVIADRLSISPKTVLAHRESLMRKLGMDSTVLLARYAFREGIAQC